MMTIPSYRNSMIKNYSSVTVSSTRPAQIVYCFYHQRNFVETYFLRNVVSNGPLALTISSRGRHFKNVMMQTIVDEWPSVSVIDTETMPPYRNIMIKNYYSVTLSSNVQL